VSVSANGTKRPAKEHDGSEDDHKSNKKTKFAKSEKSATKSGKKTDTESGPLVLYPLQDGHP
jgi:hypothetical protein